MPNSNLPSEIQVNKFITEEKTQILTLIDNHHRVLLQANPALGKTYFFKKLAEDIISGKRKGRLIFVAPFLVIMDQFKNDLNVMGVKVDLELKGDTKRKKLESLDKIITSTFQSLHHIIDDLTSDDILVVDEAHALFYNYNKDNMPRQYYTRPFQNLYHTKSKLVLMSGTPNLSLLPILRLHHINITKQNETKAEIKIEYSNLNRLEIVKEFALKVIKLNGKDKLNIIYFKSVNNCIKIGEMLNDMGYKTEVITSLHKDSDTYNSIVETQTIPQDVQFLVTTNVISTGTNINNTNIGSALMINEYSPLEIKQFSKRFRKKQDIIVEVVNDGYVTGLCTHSLAEINNQRNYLTQSLKSHESLNNIPNSNYNFQKSYDKTDLATPNNFINETLERYLKQESFFIDDAQNSYVTPDEIEIELNKYSDINATVMYDYDSIKKLNIKLGIDTSNSKTDANFKAKIKRLIDDFDNNTEAYLSAIMFDKNMDYFIKNKTRNLVSNEFSKQVQYSKNIINNVNSALFHKNILMPFLEYRGYFNSTKDFIKALRSNKNINSCITSLVANNLMLNYFSIDKKPTEYEPTLSREYYSLKYNNNIPINHLSNDLNILIKIIELTFEFCFDQEKVVISKLKEKLENDTALKKLILNSNGFTLFPLTTIKKDENSFNINNYVVKGIFQGIFYTNQGLSKTTIKGKPIRSISLKDKLPTGYKNLGLDVSTSYLKKDPKLVTSILNTTSEEPLKEVKTNNVNYINSYELIIKEQL